MFLTHAQILFIFLISNDNEIAGIFFVLIFLLVNKIVTAFLTAIKNFLNW